MKKFNDFIRRLFGVKTVQAKPNGKYIKKEKPFESTSKRFHPTKRH